MPIYPRRGKHRVVVWACGKAHEKIVTGELAHAQEAERRMRERLGLVTDIPGDSDPAPPADASEVIWIAGGVGTYVYFVQAGKDGPVKIGWTKHAAVRMRYMQTGNPERLHLLCAVPGGRWLERTFHRAFADHRIDGEWYSPVPVLMRLVEELSHSNRHARNHGKPPWRAGDSSTIS
jgi:hypothetical protein